MKILLAALFIGGLSTASLAAPDNIGLGQNFQKNIEYPQEAKEHNIEATVWVEFSVDSQGEIENVRPLTNHGYGLEEEVVSAVKELDGQTIAEEGKYRVPVKFEIR